MKEIVKYHNYLNSLNFKGFTAADYNFFMYLCSTMKEKGTEEMSFSMNEICNCVGYMRKGNAEEYAAVLKRMNEKLLSMQAHFETSTELVSFVLFPTFRVNKETGMLTVRVNKDFQYLLNELTKNFTLFELREFTELSSKYSKTLYRLLKQYRKTGEYFVKVDELRTLLGCPEKYENKHLMRFIITPAVEELQKDFPTLSCEVVRAYKKGRPIIGYHFTFEVGDQVPGQTTLDQAAAEMQKYERKKKSKKPPMATGEQHNFDYDNLERELLRRQ